MKHFAFPFIAAGIGLVLAMGLARYGTGAAGTEPLLPPLTLLFMSEFGFLVTAAGTWVGVQSWLAQRGPWWMLLVALACLVLAAAFVYVGLSLWRELTPV